MLFLLPCSKRLPLVESTMITVIVPIRRMSPARPHVQTQGRMAVGGASHGLVLNFRYNTTNQFTLYWQHTRIITNISI